MADKEASQLGNDESLDATWAKREEELSKSGADGKTWEGIDKVSSVVPLPIEYERLADRPGLVQKSPQHGLDAIRGKYKRSSELQQDAATHSLRSSSRMKNATIEEERRRQLQDTTAMATHAKEHSESSKMLGRQDRSLLGTTKQDKARTSFSAAPSTSSSGRLVNGLGVVMVPWSQEELDLLIRSKAEDKPWEEIIKVSANVI